MDSKGYFALLAVIFALLATTLASVAGFDLVAVKAGVVVLVIAALALLFVVGVALGRSGRS
jgi:hypothetical protein